MNTAPGIGRTVGSHLVAHTAEIAGSSSVFTVMGGGSSKVL
jgi:hypothetical protein